MGRKPTGRVMTTITFRLFPDDKDRLILRAMRRHQKLNEYMRLWVERDLHRPKKP